MRYDDAPLPAAVVCRGIGPPVHLWMTRQARSDHFFGSFAAQRELGGKMEDGQALLIWPIVGATAGWLAGMPVKGGGNGLIGEITAPLPTAWITTIVGIIGGLIAGWMLPQIGIIIGGGFIAAIINAFIGAVILLIVLRLVSRAA